MTYEPRNDSSNDFLSEKNVKKVVRASKRRSIIRTIMISIIVVPVILIAVWFTNGVILNQAFNVLNREVQVYEVTMSPNVYVGAYSVSQGFLSEKITYTTYKIVNGKPTPWNPIAVTYRFPYGNSFVRDANGENGPAIYPNLVSPTSAYYNTETGQRQVTFYLPQILYPHYRDDLKQLMSMSDSQSVEMALSFNQPYTLTKVKKMLPTNVEQNWYWVDAYSQQDVKMYSQSKEQLGILSNLYGFNAQSVSGGKQSFLDHQNYDSTISGEEQTFLDALTIGANNQPMFREIYHNLRHGNSKLTPADVKIIGVIVSGTPTELKKLIGASYIKASVMGAVVNNR